jgi:hypothetical protein
MCSDASRARSDYKQHEQCVQGWVGDGDNAAFSLNFLPVTEELENLYYTDAGDGVQVASSVCSGRNIERSGLTVIS